MSNANIHGLLADILAALLADDAGDATAAHQLTLIGHVDGIETALTAANASLDAIEAKQIAGPTSAATSQSVVQATGSDWLNNINGGLTAARGIPLLGYNGSTKLLQLGAGGQTLTQPYGLEYETVAASQTAQVLGGTGAAGDLLNHVMVQPTTVAPGVVTILDDAIEVHAYPGGTVGAELQPFRIDIGARSVSGAWKITTGANVKCVAFGDFSA